MGHQWGYFNMFELVYLFTAISGIVDDVVIHQTLLYFIVSWHSELLRNVMLDSYNLHTCAHNTRTALTEINTHFENCAV